MPARLKSSLVGLWEPNRIPLRVPQVVEGERDPLAGITNLDAVEETQAVEVLRFETQNTIYKLLPFLQKHLFFSHHV